MSADHRLIGVMQAAWGKSRNNIRSRQVHDLAPTHYNFVMPHASLRQALAKPIATNGSGSAKLWQPRSPAMAAGLTDHIWTLKEVLMFRVPPWPQPQTV